MERRTSELDEILGKTHVKDIESYLTSQSGELLQSNTAFADYMHQLIHEKNLSQQEIFLKADIPERYGYKLLAEEKHTRQRDVVLRICYAAEFSLEETQKALKIYGMPELYSRIPRDAVLMVCFSERPGSILDVNACLKNHHMEMLRSSGVQD